MSQATTISPKELKKILANPPKDLFILDVRNPSEYREHNIKGHLIPLPELEQRLDELPEDKNTFIVVHCQHGVRSSHARDFLHTKGYHHCVSLEGGLEAFKNV